MSRSRNTAITVSLLAILASVSCAREARIEPARSAQQVRAGTEGARTVREITDVGGVRVSASAQGWSGDPRTTEEVTPFRITIENDSDEYVRLDYRSFYLVDERGDYYRALPPFRYGGDPPGPRIVRADRLPKEWTSRDFAVYPMYGRRPGVDVYDGRAPYDSEYYKTHARYWEGKDLPNEDILAKAVPEGVVEPGGMVEGWLFFEKVDPGTEGPLTLYADVINAHTGETLGQISIPFEVGGSEEAGG